MNVISDAITWINDPLNWTQPDGLFDQLGAHLYMTVIAVAIAALIALPLGLWLGHTGKGAGSTIVALNTTRALPTFGILIILASAGLFGDPAAIIAAAVFAIPLILSNTYTGISGVDPSVRDAARGMGMSGSGSLWLVELPLAIPLVAGGMRTAIVQVVATIPLAAYVGGGGLGVSIQSGFATQNYGKVLAAGVIVALLCLIVDGLLWIGQRLVTPSALRVRHT